MTAPFTLHLGKCEEVLKSQPDNSVDSIVTDPPYELGFMGKVWDASGIANNVDMWREALRVLKPGGHLLAFSGSRTYHRMACAIEDAGFDVRDQIMWLYGSGFPKSRNLDGDWQGWGTALKPAHEPICVARKPLIGTVAANVLEHGTGALNINACRVGTESTRRPIGKPLNGGAYGSDRGELASLDHIGGSDAGRWPANVIHDGSAEVLEAFPESAPPCGSAKKTHGNGGLYEMGAAGAPGRIYKDASTSAARFFYCAKASRKDRHEGLEDPGPQFEQQSTRVFDWKRRV
jgi:DNA methylase